MALLRPASFWIRFDDCILSKADDDPLSLCRFDHRYLGAQIL